MQIGRMGKVGVASQAVKGMLGCPHSAMTLALSGFVYKHIPGHQDLE